MKTSNTNLKTFKITRHRLMAKIFTKSSRLKKITFCPPLTYLKCSRATDTEKQSSVRGKVGMRQGLPRCQCPPRVSASDWADKCAPALPSPPSRAASTSSFLHDTHDLFYYFYFSLIILLNGLFRCSMKLLKFPFRM